MGMITGAVVGNNTPKNGSIIIKTPGKDGITYQENNTHVSNIPSLVSVNAKLDGKFDNALYYSYPSGSY